MKWMKERDLLIAQTMAFVQSVTGKKPDALMFAGAPTKATTTTTAVVDIATMVNETTVISEPAKSEPSKSEPPKSEPSKSGPSKSGPSKSEPSRFEPVKAAPPNSAPLNSAPSRPIQVLRAEPPVDVQSEIKARIANFRAHQERFLRERDEYCSATMAKVRAALRENIEPPRSVK
jgi:hypothetical protein